MSVPISGQPTKGSERSPAPPQTYEVVKDYRRRRAKDRGEEPSPYVGREVLRSLFDHSDRFD